MKNRFPSRAKRTEKWFYIHFLIYKPLIQKLFKNVEFWGNKVQLKE